MNKVENSEMTKHKKQVDDQQLRRLVYPEPLRLVTGGPGGESILILGSQKAALYDCGMACFADNLIKNISKYLSEKQMNLDYIILSHTHYDHIGGLPYVLEKWPSVLVCASQKAKQVLENSNALNTIKLLGEKAKEKYKIDNISITTKGMRVDMILKDQDSISLGTEKVIAYETKGHTDCSMSYYILPEKIMLASESTGVYASKGVVYTQPLKSLSQTIDSAKKLKNMDIDELIIPHYGRYIGDESEYFDDYIKNAIEEQNYIFDLFNKYRTVEQVLQAHEKKMWVGKRREEQPYEAYKLNAEIVINRIYNEWKRDKSNQSSKQPDAE